jgi:hypothetical protein
VEFNDLSWPLLVMVSPKVYDKGSVELMQSTFERIYQRGDRYAFITVSPRGASPPGAQERKAIAEWANLPRSRKFSRDLCVCSASVLESALMRGALTAMMWIWTPASPHKAVADLSEALDYTLSMLEQAGVPLPRPAAMMRSEVESWVASKI